MVDTDIQAQFTILDKDLNSTMLFKIKADGTIERGPNFTTNDEMSLKFWEAVENSRRPLPGYAAPSA